MTEDYVSYLEALGMWHAYNNRIKSTFIVAVRTTTVDPRADSKVRERKLMDDVISRLSLTAQQDSK